MIIFSSKEINIERLPIEPDMYEFRVDLYENFPHLMNTIKNSRDKGKEAVEASLPDFKLFKRKTIFTLRDKGEGGRYDGSLAEKLVFYEYILSKTGFYIDIEYRYFKEFACVIKNQEYIKRVILSIHNFDEFKSSLFIVKNLNMDYSPFFYKFVFKIDTLKELLMFSNLLKNSKVDFCLLSVGKTSFISRILYQHLGSKAVYIGKKGDETAPNQLNELDASLYNLQNINQNTIVGGIVGGKQILLSKGLKFYNEYFQEKQQNFVYLPFVVNDVNDFVSFVHTAGFRFYGFSITMPFKKELPMLINKKEGIANLWMVNTNEVFLTDEKAFLESFLKLEISSNTKIILLGTGAMAQTVIKLLPQNEIFVLGRDPKKVDHIVNNHFHTKSYAFFDATNVEEKVCLINTTPLGMNAESVFELLKPDDGLKSSKDFKAKINKDFFDTSESIFFDCVIDLPYSEQKTKLSEFCKINNIPCIDGHEFWHVQANEQLNIFLSFL